jgi:hypothetical protein
MKFTLNWLKEFIEFDGSAIELAKLLTMAGLEVESLTALPEPDSRRQDWLFEIAVIVWACSESPGKFAL